MSGDLTVERLVEAAAMFAALSDPARLELLTLLNQGERSVGELASAVDEKLSTVSARLQILYRARLVVRRREGKTVRYALADEHVVELLENAIAHACE